MSYATQALAVQHYPDLLKLWAANMSDVRIREALDRRFRWLYDQNPEGAVDTRVAIHEEQGQVVGCGSLYPRRMFVAGAELKAGVAADFAVNRDHRIGGAALSIQRALISSENYGFSFLFGSPNKASEAILLRVGYKAFATAHAWVKPLSIAYKIRSYVGSARLARAIAMPVDVALSVRDRAKLPDATHTTVQIVERADARFDELWHRAKDAYTVTGERSSAYLNWRYGTFTTMPYRFFCVTNARSELIGYIAFSIQDGKVFVADLFALDMEGTAELVVMQFARAMKTRGLQSIFIWYAGNPSLGKRLERLGFYPSAGQLRRLVAYSKTLTPEQQRIIFDANNWYMFDGEIDI
jgi:ribosomal protein S18 acetylase RimI-like enzyme